MTPLVDQLGRKVLDRWLTTLTPPALGFAAVALAVHALGHRNALDHRLFEAGVRQWAGGGTARVAMGMLALLALATAVEAASAAVRRLWSGDWIGPAAALARRLTERRQARWDELDRRVREAQDAAGDPPTEEELARMAAPAAERDALCTARPTSPTWTGSRLNALHDRVFHEYALELDACWPRLWLVMSDAARQEVTAARLRFDRAANLATWALPYAVAGLLWWPSLLVAGALGWVGARRGRAAAADYAELVEAAADVHGRELAGAMGVALPEQGFPPSAGREASLRARKGT
ncbi:hypothetical protein [Streptomyces coeruleorubidus]|uniref:hypothetical protein n=1 Tax=Streptomyces coeruleorubidus TaxID=116188 RepID=UPI0033AAEF42